MFCPVILIHSMGSKIIPADKMGAAQNPSHAKDDGEKPCHMCDTDTHHCGADIFRDLGNRFEVIDTKAP